MTLAAFAFHGDSRLSQYPWLLLAVYVVTVGVVQLLALWAATSRLPWLLRVLVVWTPIALLATVRAYEPAIVLLLSAALTIGLSLVLARFSSPREPAANSRTVWWRFRLADLLVLMLVLGTWLGVTGRWVTPQYQLSLRDHFYVLLLASAAAVPFSLLAVLAHQIARGPRRVRAILLAMCVLWLTSLLWRWFNVPLYLGQGQPSLGQNWPRETANDIGVLGTQITGLVICLVMPYGIWRAARTWPEKSRRRVVLASIAVALGCGIPLSFVAWEMFRDKSWATLGQWGLELAIHSVFPFSLTLFIALITRLCTVGWTQPTGWKSRLARATIFLLALTAGLPGLWIYWQMLWYAPYPKVNAGLENQYDRLIAIAKRMNAFFNGGSMPPAVAAELDEAVLLVRQHNQVPQHVIESRWNPETGLTGHDLMAITGRFREAAENAVRAREFDRLADCGVAIIRFDAMVGQGEQGQFAYQGYELLSLHRREFSPAKARDVIGLLRQTIAERYDVEFLIACQRAQSERMTGWHTKLRSALERLTGKSRKDGWSSQAAQHYRETRKGWDVMNLLLQTDMAIGVFRSDHGRLPATLSELVPAYIPEMPVDPYSGRALVYRPRTGSFELYSVGPNGTDDGGRVPPRTGPPGDTRYDIPLEPPRAGKQ